MMGEKDNIARPQFVIEKDTSPYTRNFLNEFQEAIFENPEAVIVLTSLQKAVGQLKERPKVDDNTKRLVDIYFEAGLDQNHDFDEDTERAIKDDFDQQNLVKRFKNRSLGNRARGEARNSAQRNRVAVFASRVVFYKSMRSDRELPRAG